MTLAPRPSRYDYQQVTLSAQEIAQGAHQHHLGGGPQAWQQRGAFQLAALQHLGLQPSDSVLDVGCGPLRGGIHLLSFLQPGNYWGFDFNTSFVAAAHAVLAKSGHSRATEQVMVLEDFDFARLGRTFDWLLCFSVLNHCNAAQRTLFFERVRHAVHPRSRVLITHAGWFEPQQIQAQGLAVLQSFNTESSLGPHLQLQDWGFDDGVLDRLPFVVLGQRT